LRSQHRFLEIGLKSQQRLKKALIVKEMIMTQIALEDFLKEQKDNFKVTIEEIPTDLDHLKVTPFKKGAGCSCGISITVKKTAIEAVVKTGESHFCCGKELAVVQPVFKKGEGIALNELFLQIYNNSQESQKKVIQPLLSSPSPAQTYNIPMPYAGCMGGQSSQPGQLIAPLSSPSSGPIRPLDSTVFDCCCTGSNTYYQWDSGSRYWWAARHCLNGDRTCPSYYNGGGPYCPYTNQGDCPCPNCKVGYCQGK